MTRTFIALEMNKAAQDHLADVIRRVGHVLPTVRWVDPVGIHLTLAFLGELDDAQLAEVIQVAEAVAGRMPAFSYRLSHLGIFGPPRQPRVIWLGIDEPSGALRLLQRTLQQELLRHNFELDDKPFSPHLTLARVKNPLPPVEQRQLQAMLDKPHQQKVASTHSYPVTNIEVLKSELSREGAYYTVLRTCPLEGS